MTKLVGTCVELLYGEELLLGGRVGLQDWGLLGSDFNRCGRSGAGYQVLAIRRETARDRCSGC